MGSHHIRTGKTIIIDSNEIDFVYLPIERITYIRKAIYRRDNIIFPYFIIKSSIPHDIKTNRYLFGFFLLNF